VPYIESMASLAGFADAKRSTPVASVQQETPTPSPQRSSAPLAGFAPAAKRSGPPAAAAESAEYMERQLQMEKQLVQLENRLEQQYLASQVTGSSEVQDSKEPSRPATADSEIVQGLKFIVQDVRKCLKRCELLIQLPEIRMFMRRFQRSLEVNAILHEKWIGPEASRSPRVEEDLEAGISGMPPRNSMMSQSSPNFNFSSGAPSPESSRDDSDMRASSRGGMKGSVRKKPFRTVVDWTRPHTPLALEPVLQVGARSVKLPNIASQ